MSQIKTKFIADGAVTDVKLASTFIKASGAVPFAGDQDMGTHKLTGLGAPSNPTDAATKSYVDGLLTTSTRNKESITLSSTNITNQYIDLAHPILVKSLDFACSGLVFNEGVDYTVSLTGGSGGVTRVTFAGDLATAGAAALASGDVVYVKYVY